MLRPEREHLVHGLIYPVPDPEFPFLGVHFTRTVHGDVEAGPNAVLAFAREGYGWKTRASGRARSARCGTAAFWSMARKYWRTGAYEVYRSLSKAAFVKALQRLVPELKPEDVKAGGSGVSAQAVRPDGSAPGRLPHRHQCRRDPRTERAVTGGDGLAGDRTPHRGTRRSDLRSALRARGGGLFRHLISLL